MLGASLEPDIARMLMSFGADPAALFHADSFTLETAVMQFSTSVRGLKRKTVSVERQLRWLQQMVADPFAPYLSVINSYPTDERCKVVGANLMAHMIGAQKEHPVISRRTQKPLWIRVYNNYVDMAALRKHNPCAVFISNVTDDSTPQKMERVRDVLEMFNDVPRIVMMAGAQDPVTFCADRLRMGVSRPIQLGGKAIAVSIFEDL